MPALSPIASVDCGVDYLTCSYNEYVDHARLGLFISRVKRIEQRSGELVSAWGLSGYSGERVGGLEWGTRHDGAIVRLSGFSAQQWWRRFGALASNCSRIDLQETFVYDEHWSRTMMRHWREVRRFYKSGKRRPKPKIINGPDGPETLYSGKRVSDTFLRCYHRGSKTCRPEHQGHIRYEAELKGKRALLELQSLLKRRRIHDEVRRRCFTLFSDRGCRLQWSNAAISRIRVAIPRTSVNQRLEWLQKAVRPSVMELIELGYGEQVLRSLGLCDGP